MTHASVFSGIGGPEIAATLLGWDNVFHCEINPFGRKVLEYWYPNSKSYEDITKTDFSEWRGRVNVLSGGFPCQPFSYAGQRRGATDDRYLWPYMFKCIDQVRPDWVVCENVAGILTMVEQGEVSAMDSQTTLFGEADGLRRYRLRETFTLQRICDDLEQHGYEVQPVLIPACGVGAPHRRDRVFIVGHNALADTDRRADGRGAGENAGKSGEERLQERNEIRQPNQPSQIRPQSEGHTIADSTSSRLQYGNKSRSEGGEVGEIQGEGYRAVGDLYAASNGNRGSASNSVSCGEGTPRTSEGAEGVRSHADIQPQQREFTPEWSDGFYAVLRYASDAYCGSNKERPGQRGFLGKAEEEGKTNGHSYGGIRYSEGQPGSERWRLFPSVSPVHRGNDGLPFNVDDLTLPFGRWRNESIKAYGNAIVPQVMYEIFRTIERVENGDTMTQETAFNL